MAHPQAYLSSGMAVFSTRAGKYRQRQRIQGMSVVIRSDPNDDRDTMTARLQTQFPSICKTITMFEHTVGDYFDDFDRQLQGEKFLHAVLLHIAQSNAVRAREVQDLASRWLAINKEAFEMLGPEHCVEHVFTKEDIETYDMGLLEETLTHIQLAARNQYAAAPDAEKRLQERHQRMLHEHRELVLSQAPTFTTIPPPPPIFSNLRVASNPENSQVGRRQGQIRQIPPPVGQFPAQRARYPQQRLTPSTEVLEHIHPGSTNRGDFHSDPNINNFDPHNLDYNLAIPTRGLPGPFSYASLPHIPLSERQRNYNSGALPRGKKNPAKKSSDDARKAGYRGISRRQSSNGGSFADFGVPQMVESPRYVEPQREGQSLNMQIGPAFLGGVHVNHPNRYVSHPFLGQPGGFQGPTHTENQASRQMAREYLRGTKIWIGNIPRDFNRAMVEEMLQPCRGLQGISEPRAPSEGINMHAFVYANFRAQDEAAEALDRLPQTRLKCLGDGNFLKTSWPFKNDSTRHPNQKTYKGRVEQATPYTSPTKTWMDKGSDRSLTGEADEDAPHGEKDSGNLGTASKAKDRRKTFTNTSVVESVDSPQLNLSQAPRMAVPETDALTTTGMSAPAGASPKSVELLNGDRNSAAAHHQADQNEEPAQSRPAPNDGGPSTVDGTDDPTPITKPTPHMEQSSYEPGPRQRDDTQKGPTTATNRHKKSNQKPKSSNKPQNPKERPPSRTVSFSENIKPTAKSEATTASVAKDFLGEAAHPTPEDDAAKARNAEVEVTKSVTTRGSSVPTTTTPKVQRPMDSSSLVTLPKQPKKPARPACPGPEKQAPAPITRFSKQANSPDSETEAGLSIQPSSNGTPILEMQHAAPTESGSKTAEPALDLSEPSSLNLSPKEEQELAAQVISWDGSNSTNVEDGDESLYNSSTAPTSYLQTERSNSLADGSQTSMANPDEPSPKSQARSAGFDPEQLRTKLHTDIKGTIEPSENALGEDLRPRSTPMPLDPAPVLTRQKKKKKRSKEPKESAPAEEKGGSSGSKETAIVAEKQPIGAGLTSSEQTKPPSSVVDAKPQQSQTSKPKGEELVGAPSVTIAPGLRTPPSTMLSNLPEPETPFKCDGRADLPVTKGHHQRDSQESNPFAGYDIAEQSSSSRHYGELGSPQKKMNTTETSQELRQAMKEAGYLTSFGPSSACHFAVKDPILARLGDMFEQEEQCKEAEAEDDKIQFSEKGKTFIMSQAEMQKQIDTRAFLEQAAAGKRLAEGLPPRTPARDAKGKGKTVGEESPVKSLYDQVEQIALHNVHVKAQRGERNPGDSFEDRMAKEGLFLLNTSPKNGSSRRKSAEWTSKAEQYIKDGSKSPNTPLPATPTRRSKTSDVHHPSSSLMMSLQEQGKLPEGDLPVVMTRPGSKTAVIKLKPGEDASKVAADHLANPEAIFGTDKIKLSSIEEISAAFAKPGGAMSHLSQTREDPAISPKTATGDYLDAEAKSIISVLDSESGDATETRQGDVEYPGLPRSRRRSHVKEDETSAPSKGGYAAVARRSIDEKREDEYKEGKKQVNTDTKQDPWAPDDVWGPGKSGGKGTSLSRGAMSKRGGR